MKKILSKITRLLLVFLIVFNGTNTVKASQIEYMNKIVNTISYEKVMKQDLLCLLVGYNEYLKDLQCDENGNVFIITKSGKKILYDDKKSKSFEGKLANPDLQDMMEQNYPLNYTTKIMGKNVDPGRIRCYDLMSEVYGGSQGAIEKNLTNVSVGGRRFQFNKSNRASEELRTVMGELTVVCKQNPKINSFVYPSSGTFNYRYIAGTNRLSPHAYGTAIDLARDKRDYWQWASKEEGEKRLQNYPKELVEVFERHNFVWGGKWSHFDILHFEYRPEITYKARWFGENQNKDALWYQGAPANDAIVKECINKIENKIKY